MLSSYSIHWCQPAANIPPTTTPGWTRTLDLYIHIYSVSYGFSWQSSPWWPMSVIISIYCSKLASHRNATPSISLNQYWPFLVVFIFQMLPLVVRPSGFRDKTPGFLCQCNLSLCGNQHLLATPVSNNITHEFVRPSPLDILSSSPVSALPASGQHSRACSTLFLYTRLQPLTPYAADWQPAPIRCSSALCYRQHYWVGVHVT